MAKSTKTGTGTNKKKQGLEKPETVESAAITPEFDDVEKAPDIEDTQEAALETIAPEKVAGESLTDDFESDASVDAEILPENEGAGFDDIEADLLEAEEVIKSEPDSTNVPNAGDGAQDVEATDDVLVEDALDAEPKPFDEKEAADDNETEALKDTSNVDLQPAVAPVPQVVKGSIWPAVFGGMIAAMIGFIAGRGDVVDQFLPASMQRASFDTATLEADNAALREDAVALLADSAALKEETAALKGETAALEEETIALKATALELSSQTQTQEARLSALEEMSAVAMEEVSVGAMEEVSAVAILESVSALEADIEVLASRLGAIESRPAVEIEPAASPEAVDALQLELMAQNAQIAALAARAEAAESSAAGEAARILARAALARVMMAVDNGEAFSPALSDLEEVTLVAVPEALRGAAEEGVPTLAALQDSFPDAARSGLSAARAETPEIDVTGIADFLKRQLNIRSVTPREGADPDAVLSRAQAALRAGDLGTAITEMEALPDSARAEMSDWLDAASTRKAAQDAAQELADSLNSN